MSPRTFSSKSSTEVKLPRFRTFLAMVKLAMLERLMKALLPDTA